MFRPHRSTSVGGRLNASSAQGVRNRSSSLSRLSQNSFSRRSSFADQDKRAKDVRPLSERSYQYKCVSKLVKFLGDNGYEYKISEKMLSNPSSKDVHRIFECIYSSFNHGYKISKKPEEEILRILKSLQYPFLMTKSTLLNTGSQRAWSAVLGMLMWLIEISQYSASQEAEASRDPSALGANTVTHDILGKSFARFYGSGLDISQEEEDKCFQKIAGLDDAREQLLTEEEKYEQFEKQLNELEVEEALLHEKERQMKIVQSDANNLKDYISGMQDRIGTKKEDIDKKMSESQKNSEILKRQHEEIEKLRKICHEQNQKGENMYQVHSKRQDMVVKLNREEEQLRLSKQQKLSSEHELSRLKSKVEELCRAFSKSYSEIYPKEMFEARFPGCSKEDLNRINIQLMSLSKKLKKEEVSTENILIKLEEHFQELKLQLIMSTQDLNDNNIRMEEAKRFFEDRQTKLKDELDQVEASDEATTQAIAKLQDVLAITPKQKHAHINKLQQQLEELREELNKVEDESIKKVKDEAQKFEDAIASLEREDKELVEILLSTFRD